MQIRLAGGSTGAPPYGSPQPRAEGETRPLEGLGILLVEDEIMIGLELTDALNAAGAEVIYARNLRKAMRTLEGRAFDAAILDVNLGHGETCVPIADALKARGVPFILHSGDLNRLGEVVAGIGAPVVAKPMPSARVIDKLVEVLGR